MRIARGRGAAMIATPLLAPMQPCATVFVPGGYSLLDCCPPCRFFSDVTLRRFRAGFLHNL